jgi:pimeloyl-ACP methyl ester carboxylesterase
VFLNGTADPADPPVNVAAATRTMPHALLVSVPGTAHWVLN